MVVAGVMTPVVGVERAGDVADWAMTQGPGLRWGVAAIRIVRG